MEAQVRFTRYGIQAHRLHWPDAADRVRVRRQAMKLRFWSPDVSVVGDVPFTPLEGLPAGFYELPLETIGGQKGGRIVFLAPEAAGEPVVWVLEALPKPESGWSDNDLARFRSGKDLVRERWVVGKESGCEG